MAINNELLTAWDVSQFHFIRPEFLFLVPLVLALWFLAKRAVSNSGWENYLPIETIRALRVNEQNKSVWLHWYFLIAALLLCLAAAGPTWVKQPVPTLQNQRALVVLLDLSPSMLAQDLKPDRLTRAKYKLIDILRQYKDGQIALIAYSGDAHTVSPLTDDPNTLQALLPALHPSIMPSQGSNTEAAIALAEQLLRDAQLSSGEILLITDGVASSAMRTIGDDLASTITLSILGVGSSEPSPIPAGGGGFLRGEDGEIVLSQVNDSELRQFSGRLGGRYARLNTTEEDINFLIPEGFQAGALTEEKLSDTSFDSWTDMGHLFLLLVLPLAAWCFRRGFIYCLPILFLIPSESSWADEVTPADALSNSTDDFSWGHLWQTPDQRAQTLLEQEQYASAAKTFKRKDWQAIANYKNGDFAAAAKQLEGTTDATSLYNKGNALAMSGDLEQALKAYEQVLVAQPDHADAQHNKNVVEQLMQQSQKQQNQEQQDDQRQQEDQRQQNQDSEDNQQSSQPQSDQSESSERQESQNAEQPNETQPESSQEPNGGDKNEQQNQLEKDNESNQPQSEDNSDQKGAKEQAEQEGQRPAEEQNGENVEVAVEESGEPLKDSSEQWLRGIKDDPSGLLRRKFKYQADQKRRSASQSNSNKKRY